MMVAGIAPEMRWPSKWMLPRTSGSSPLIARSDYVHAESKGLIDRLFDGQIEPFIAHFSEREALSDDQIARLRQLIERLGRGE